MMGRFGKKGRYTCVGFLAVLVLLLPNALARGCYSPLAITDLAHRFRNGCHRLCIIHIFTCRCGYIHSPWPQRGISIEPQPREGQADAEGPAHLYTYIFEPTHTHMLSARSGAAQIRLSKQSCPTSSSLSAMGSSCGDLVFSFLPRSKSTDRASQHGPISIKLNFPGQAETG
ncbi:hypothetical protein E1301_Tti019905 [Triplophysa tibetana]|uniref:Secreted protein n=1 Tax=Triplophysa tibetana TaxID=1572043 RepID=A0A5A9PDP2_9TELE|nr:hypothetical protein E1301_Tti019905 [Triplophysa tibetana]